MTVFLIPAIASVLPAIGPVALAGAGAGFGATTWTIATVLAYAVTTGATVGASLLLNQQKKQKGDPQQVSVKQSLPGRMRSFGRNKIAGAYAFHETYLGNLYQVHVHGEGEWDAYEQWWLNDKNALVGGAYGGPAGILPWLSNVVVESHLGAEDQAASELMLAAFSASGVWTADHRLDGLAYTVLRLGAVKEKNFSKVYPNGVPALRVVARTAKVYDPRTAAIGFSENAALGILGHLTDWRGMRISPSLIDDASFAAFANVCDDPVALAGGGTEPRYRCAFSWDLSQQSPEAVLRTFLESCDAEIYPTAAGKVGIRGGGFTAPVVTLDERHIRTYRYSQGNDRLAAFNRLKLTFTHREADYQPVEIDPWEDLASQAEVGVLQQDLTLAQVPSFTQARRLGKIFSAKSNPRHRLTLQTNMGGLLALGERCVHVTLAELDIDDDFLIEKFEIAGDLSGCELQLASLSADSYAWSTAEEGAAPVVPPDSTVSAIPPDVEGVVLSLVRTQISSGAWASKVRASFTPPGGPWPTIGRYRRAGDAAWLEMVADGDAAMITPDVLANDVIYEFQLAHTGFGGVNSANIGTWSDIEMIEVISDPAMINLLPHSDDPDQWDATRVDVTSGALVADPMGGTGGRAITFAEDAGYIYAAGAIEGDLSGRTFTLSVHLRAPAGKAKIMFIAFSDASYLASEITLSGAWQRVSLTATMPPGANHLRLLLDNRSLQGLTDASGGVVEIFGGMIQERFSASAYKSTP